MGIKPDHYFKLEDGTQIKNLYELGKALEKMPKKIFDHHVSEEKNDFSSWVRDAIGDKELAEKMASVKTSETMSKYIKEKINAGQKKTKQSKAQPKRERKKAAYMANEEKEISQKIAEKIKEKKTRKWHHRIAPKKQETTLAGIGGASCPYRSLRCGWQELLVGVIIGLALAMILSIIF